MRRGMFINDNLDNLQFVWESRKDFAAIMNNRLMLIIIIIIINCKSLDFKDMYVLYMLSMAY